MLESDALGSRLVGIAVIAAALGVGCEKQGAARADGDGPSYRASAPASPGAARPVPASNSAPASRGKAPGFDAACFDVYAGCSAAVGLPALSADGQRVAVADFGPEDPRDELVLTVRIIAVDTGREVSQTPLLTRADRQRDADPQTGELTPALRTELDRRARALEQSLDKEGFAPLIPMGSIHEQKASAEVAGLRASFDGRELRVIDVATGTLEFRRAIAASAPFRNPEGGNCESSPVADIALWVKRSPSVVVARVAYMSSDFCSPESPYIVWR